ncbi:MAG TPA: HPF/RaiA family ribosome-associated protein [Burkholderiales bacterium]|nr:HPF/RaiA family ribosome-associated protein [Burkholderiales bacterium]
MQISLRGVAPSDALERAIREKAQKLEHFYDRITGCRVALTLDAYHQRQARQFSVHVGVKVPGGAIEITREHDKSLYAALSNAFDAARRQLQDYASEQREPA